MAAEQLKLLKTERANAKRQLTTILHVTEALISEENYEEIDKIKLQELRVRFIDAHSTYGDALLNSDADIDEIEYLDKYLKQEMEHYNSVLRATKPEVVQDEHVPHPAAMLTREELAATIASMQSTVKAFSGECTEFQLFICRHKQAVKYITSYETKLAKLLDSLEGEAIRAVAGCAVIGGESGYNEAIKKLESRFGDRHKIMNALMNNLESTKPIRTPQQIQALADELYNARLSFEVMNCLDELTPKFVARVSERLPCDHAKRWKSRAMDHKTTFDAYPGFGVFVDFVQRLAQDANDPLYGSPVEPPKRPVEVCKRAHIVSHNMATAHNKGSLHKCPMCKSAHRLTQCPIFKNEDIKSRLDFVNNRELCYKCLLDNHVTNDCFSKRTCDICDRSGHNTLVHQKSYTAVVSNKAATHVASMLPVVKVKINGRHVTNALIDSGSSNSFISAKLANSLSLRGTKTMLSISTMNSVTRKLTLMYNIVVSDLNDSQRINLSRVYATESIPVPRVRIDLDQLEHLDGVTPGDPNDVGLLLGEDCGSMLLPLETRVGRSDEPYAARISLGWYIAGPTRMDSVADECHSNLCVGEPCAEQWNKLWGIDHELADIKAMSVEDSKVIQRWDEGYELIEGHVQLPIPWKQERPWLPDNFEMAHKRLASLKRRLDRDNRYELYDVEMKKMINNHYAEHVPHDEQDVAPLKWYIPHHYVPKKNNRIRVVYDCGAIYRGRSLNDAVYGGPDINNGLLGVLLRFRLYEHAIAADIESMYLQVRVPSRDRNALRFLWYDDAGQLVHLRMTCHLFGGVWSGSAAVYALKKCSTISDPDPQVKDIIMRSFYVDDLLRSFPSAELMSDCVPRVRDALASAGFNLTKYTCTSQNVMSLDSTCDKPKEALLPSMDTKALGVRWNVRDDTLYFSPVDGQCEVECLTKRAVLKEVASMYDPLGLISPLVLSGRLIFQETVVRKLDWDASLPDDLAVKWVAWRRNVQRLLDLRIPRSILPCFPNNTQLHHFADASNSGYGCVTYLRAIDQHGIITSRLLYSKTRVAPLKQHTIPRLELCAAVLAVQMDATLASEISADVHLQPSVYWTDSMIVLAYLQDDSKRYQTFVGNRVAKIRSHSESSQWRHVPSEQNPADLASRGTLSVAHLASSEWFNGPKFLTQQETEWPSCEQLVPLLDDDVEVKRNVISHLVDASMPSMIDDTVSKYSKLIKVESYRKNWKQCQYLVEEFWTRWTKRYLHQLQERQIWRNEQSNLASGDVVLLVDVFEPRSTWPIGLVVDVKRGCDDNVRTVTVRCKGKLFVRPITKVVYLEGHLDG